MARPHRGAKAGFDVASVQASSTAGEPRRSITRDDVMSALDVAVLLDIPKSTIEDWARRGLVPSRKRGRRRLFLRWEVEAWLVDKD